VLPHNHLHRRGCVLVVGPHRPYLAYVSDVLPSLGEEGVRTCTLRDLVPEGAGAAEETDPEVARLKSSDGLVRASEPAVRFYEEPPTEPMLLETPELVDALGRASPLLDEAQELTDAESQNAARALPLAQLPDRPRPPLPDGTACVIGDPTVAERPRVRSLAPELTKGLEFDLVVLVEPRERLSAVDRYVAMTRATGQLLVLTDR
jgi:hypothetical protein